MQRTAPAFVVPFALATLATALVTTLARAATPAPAPANAWQGVYLAAMSEGLVSPPRLVVESCADGQCSMSYEYLGHHVCGLEVSLRPPTGPGEAKASASDCTLTAVFSGTDHSRRIELRDIAKACSDDCGAGVEVIPGPFKLADMRQYQPSFACAKASTPTERLICSSYDLARADRELAASYKALKIDGLATSQRAWLKQRDRCAADPKSAASCLKDAQFTRAAFLKRLADATATPPETEASVPVANVVALPQWLAAAKKLSSDAYADSVAKPILAVPRLRAWIGAPLADRLAAPSTYCDGTFASVEAGALVLRRETCPPAIDMLVIMPDGALWTAATTEDGILHVTSPASAPASDPQPIAAAKARMLEQAKIHAGQRNLVEKEAVIERRAATLPAVAGADYQLAPCAGVDPAAAHQLAVEARAEGLTAFADQQEKAATACAPPSTKG